MFTEKKSLEMSLTAFRVLFACIGRPRLCTRLANAAARVQGEILAFAQLENYSAVEPGVTSAPTSTPHELDKRLY